MCENERYISYDGEEEGDATFIPKCVKCSRYVKADDSIKVHAWDGLLKDVPNATCKRCGRTQMLFQGFW